MTYPPEHCLYYVTIADSNGCPQGRWSGEHPTIKEALESASHARAMGWHPTVRAHDGSRVAS